jgi:hypothetical protein
LSALQDGLSLSAPLISLLGTRQKLITAAPRKLCNARISIFIFPEKKKIGKKKQVTHSGTRKLWIRAGRAAWGLGQPDPAAGPHQDLKQRPTGEKPFRGSQILHQF